MKNDDYRDVPLTLAVALTLWAAAVAAGTHAHVFARLGPGAYFALVVFATLFPTGVAIVDDRMRGWFRPRGRLAAGFSALGIAMLAAAAGVGFSGGRGVDPAAAPWAPILLFGMPVTLALCVAAIASLRDSSAATSPASTAPASRRGAPSATRTSVASRAAAAARAGG
jgi:hypothetical protein